MSQGTMTMVHAFFFPSIEKRGKKEDDDFSMMQQSGMMMHIKVHIKEDFNFFSALVASNF